MDKESAVFLGHILNCIDKVDEYIYSLSEVDFSRDIKTQDSVLRQLEIIGEAMKNLPKELMDKYPDIKWKQFIGMRDKLIHNYFGVDMSIVWDTFQKDLPVLKKQIVKILRLLS